MLCRPMTERIISTERYAGTLERAASVEFDDFSDPPFVTSTFICSHSSLEKSDVPMML